MVLQFGMLFVAIACYCCCYKSRTDIVAAWSFLHDLPRITKNNHQNHHHFHFNHENLTLTTSISLSPRGNQVSPRRFSAAGLNKVFGKNTQFHQKSGKLLVVNAALPPNEVQKLTYPHQESAHRSCVKRTASQ